MKYRALRLDTGNYSWASQSEWVFPFLLFVRMRTLGDVRGVGAGDGLLCMRRFASALRRQRQFPSRIR